MTVDQSTTPTGATTAALPPTGPRRRPGRLGVGLAAVVLSLGALSACSTGTASAGSTGTAGTASAAGSSSGTAGSAGATNTAFDQCMTANGITKPAAPGAGQDGGAPPSGQAPPSGAPTTGAPKAGQQGGARSAPPGVDAAAWQKALAACASVAGAPPSS